MSKRWLCFYCHKLNEANKRKCIYCGEKKVGSRQKLIKELDKVFSKFIRARDKKCITCGQPATDAGHYKSRGHLATRWNEKNVNGQCGGCNRYKNGALDIYSYKLIQKYGEGIIEELHKKSQEIYQPTRTELLEKIEEYKAKLKEVE